jgi:DNA-binding NarL/FixJ family response regulator
MPVSRATVGSGDVRTRVVIVVPNPVVRAGVRTLVADRAGIQVMGTAVDLARLQRSERVVKYHVSNLLTKLQARNRAHIVKLAVRSGLLPTPCSCGQGGVGRTTRDHLR